MSSSVFGMPEEEVVYQLSSTLHSYILDILGYGMYTSVYFVALYLTRELLSLICLTFTF